MRDIATVRYELRQTNEAYACAKAPADCWRHRKKLDELQAERDAILAFEKQLDELSDFDDWSQSW